MCVSKKQLAIFLSAVFFSGMANAINVDDAVKNATFSGKFRYGYISLASSALTNNISTGAAFGGEIKLVTKEIDHLQFAIAPYFSEKSSALSVGYGSNELNNDFFDSNSNSFSYIGEAYIQYSTETGAVRIGRQKIDTPFINTHEVRMFSNTFNSIWFNMDITPKVKLELGNVISWAGYDSGASQEVFKKASTGNGVTALGLVYEMSDFESIQAWYYNFDKQYSLVYSDFAHRDDSFEIAIQVANYTKKPSSNVEGFVLGASISYDIGTLTLSAAKNISVSTGDKVIALGLGGGNYYTSMDESTIGGLNDASAYVYSAELSVSENMFIKFSLGHFENYDKTIDNNEQNIAFKQDISKSLNIEFVHTLLKDQITPANNLSRQTARITYSF